MVVVSSQVMYQCQAFYIGSEIPTESRRGVEGLQQPLHTLYPGDVSQTVGYDISITVFPEYVHITYVNGGESPISLPISSLSICAAVRCVDADGDRERKFVPVHSVLTDAEPDTNHPAIYTAVFRRTEGKQVLDCHALICNSTRDALHLVNATQTAHAALRKGFSAIGNTKFFIDKRSEFDRTLKVSPSSTNKKIFMYSEDFDTRPARAETRIYSQDVDLREQRKSYVTSDYSRVNQTVVNAEGENTQNTYYIKADDYRSPTPEPVVQPETIVVKLDSERIPSPPPQQQQQTIVIDKPIIQQRPVEPPQPPRIIEQPVYIEAPKPPKIEPQTIYVDKPIFKDFPKPEPYPPPNIVENAVYIDLPTRPAPEAQTIVVDKPIIRNIPSPPPAPRPIIKENPVYIDLPAYPIPEPQHIIVDKPIINPPPPAPVAPPPIIETREVYINPPDFPPQEPHRICIEKPVFNPVKPAPLPPKPIIETRAVYIDPPEYPKQEALRIVIEKPIIRDPGPAPPAPKPEIIEKIVYIDGPRYQKQEPVRIVVEKPVIRDPGPPPPPPPPIIIEKIVYIDAPPWPVQERQKIVVEKPVIRQRGPPPQTRPIVVEKPVYVDVDSGPPPPAQRIVVEKPIFRTSGAANTGAYSYNYRQSRPANVQSAYIQRSPRGLRRYAWSEVGESTGRRQHGQYQPKWEYRGASSYHGGYTSGPRLYGQPRDFRRTENQFINERGFARRINEENRYSRGANSYTYGSAYKLNEYPRRARSDSVSS